MAYKFKRQFSSLKTGRTYVAGAIVPDELLRAPAVVADMVKVGDIQRVLIVEPIVEPIEEPIEEVIEKPKKKRKGT